MPESSKSQKSKFSRKIFREGLSILFRQMRPHKKLIWFLVTLSLVGAVFEAFIPLLAGKIFDAIIKIASHPLISLVSIFTIIIIWFLLRFFSDLISWKIGYNNQKLGAFLEAEYLAEGFGKIFGLPIAFHKERKHGEIGDRIIRAAGWLDNIMTRVSVNLLPNFLSIIVALIITFFISYKLTLVLLAAIFIYVIILWRSVPPLAGIQSKMHKAYNRAFGKAYDALGNIQEIKQVATEEYEQGGIYRNFVGKAAPLFLKMINIWMKLDFSQRLLISLSQLTIFVLAVFFVRSGAITPGELVAFNGYAAMIFGPFVILGQNWQVVQNGFVALTRAERILKLPTEKYLPWGAVSFEKIKGDVVFKNVSFSYQSSKSEILKDISFEAEPGQRVAIVGESGVGKTTLISLILGLYFPQEGSIFIDGVNIKKLDLRSYRSRVGVVSQEPTLFNDTLENNILYGNFGKSRNLVVKAAKQAHAHEFIEKFSRKYKQLVGWKGIKLSIGQKQRIALARAFLKNPDILILDEPTSALDAKSEQLIKESLEELMKGRTTFIIAHRLSTVREADKILVFENGKIVERGRHEDLINIKNGVYEKFYALQNKFH